MTTNKKPRLACQPFRGTNNKTKRKYYIPDGPYGQEPSQEAHTKASEWSGAIPGSPRNVRHIVCIMSNGGEYNDFSL